jgi:hypothetical protein
MLMSDTGGIEEIESLLGHFIPSLKVAESHRPANASQDAASKAGPTGLRNEQQDPNEH